MKTTRLLLLPLLLSAACGGDSNAADAAPTVIRVSAIPDFNKTTVAETAKDLCDYLTKEVGIEVRFEPSNDYTACVNGFVANKLDLVWFGGVTAVEADEAANGKAVFVATRDIDLQFKTYFIANKKALDEGRVRKVDRLEDLKPLLKNLTFTFGDKKSTSGHIMPRHFLVQAGIDPERDFRSPAAYRPSGGHQATMQAVANGEVDLGALNYSYYDGKGTPAEKAGAPIVWTTPAYVDYCWVGHARLGAGVLDKLRAAMSKLDPARPGHQKILAAWGAGRFVAAERDKSGSAARCCSRPSPARWRPANAWR
jgi:phosphonate transport system substrate-binding protein